VGFEIDEEEKESSLRDGSCFSHFPFANAMPAWSQLALAKQPAPQPDPNLRCFGWQPLAGLPSPSVPN